MINKKKVIPAVLLVLILLSGFYWGYGKYISSQRNTIEASGTIEATTAAVNAKIAGTLKRINAGSGDSVTKGELLAELSRNDLTAQLERDELSVLKAEAAYQEMLSGAREQELREAAANVGIAREEEKRAAGDLARIRQLAEAGAVSAVEYEKALTAGEISKNKVTAAEARLSLLEEGIRPEQLEAARLEVERNKAVLKASQAVVNDLKIYAPMDGVVVGKNYEAGEYIQPGAPLLTLADLQNLWIAVYIPTDDLPRIKLGQEASFTVSGAEGSFRGIVGEIASKGEFTPKTIQTKKERTNVVFRVKINVSNEEGVLKPGMPADVVFSGREER
ncbi:MAG: efflux RND transporter periplasmic adaptor subunit [Clostridia bacterium]|jgi:HlyD family secretion protein|nr:efflux RND transporter periplasmic adaptor subunit [Clostridia bacterium]